MPRFQIAILFTFAALFLFTQCKQDGKSKNEEQIVEAKPINVPKFNADSAYQYVKAQLDFGPRTPGTDEHAACADWLVSKLKSYGAKVTVQTFPATVYTGEKFTGKNIIAQFNPTYAKRVILAAHYDTRHIADHDPDDKDNPILGADDGASGVGVLLEIARQIQEQPINMGIDIILFDLEDYGNDGPGDNTLTWALGAQFWSANPHKRGYRASYGILLDMVGAKDAKFPREAISYTYAKDVQDKIWKLAAKMGRKDIFLNKRSKGVTDDHYFVNTVAGIPMVDIIGINEKTKTGFGAHWHTQGDNIDVISAETLNHVGQVVLAAIYQESVGQLK
jgi:Zn-dependent M28 family amino/carboxypeptidase